MIANHKSNAYHWSALATALLLITAVTTLTGAQTIKNHNTIAGVEPVGDAVIGKSARIAESAPSDIQTAHAEPAVLQTKLAVAFNPLYVGHNASKDSSLVSTVMQAELSQSAALTLVDREQMDRSLRELKLGQQGMLAPELARQLSKIVGASYFCSGELRKSGNDIVATARVIDVETTLVKLSYAILKDSEDAVAVGKKLAEQVESIILQFEHDKNNVTIVPPIQCPKIPDNWERPTVMVIIREMHVRRPQLIDPAGETEIIKRLIAENFRVVDSEYVGLMKSNQFLAKKRFRNIKTSTQYAVKKGVDVLLYGEAVSEYAAGLGDFEGCRGRIELKAINVKTDQVILADSSHGGATDLAETVAGKKAIQQAANRLADIFLYELAEKWNNK